MEFRRTVALAACSAALLAGCGGSSVPAVPAGATESGAITANSPSRIYLTNYNANEVRTFRSSGKTVKPVFTHGISGPHFIAIGDTKLYVANSGATVTAYNPKNGKQTKPTISQNLQYAMGLAVNLKGTVYVGDYTNGTITTYNGKNGKQLALTITGLTAPLGIAVDKQNKVYVAQNGALSVFNADGSPALTITSGIDSPQAVAVDLNGKIYVSNCPASGSGFVTTYFPNGKRASPTIDGISCPEGLAVDSGGTIYVAIAGTGSSGGMMTFSASGTKKSPTIKQNGQAFGIAL
jgi:hypothetical protein